MSLELKQHLRMTQQLVMTPQLQQAIKLLQLSRMELVDLVRTEMNENPLLDGKKSVAESIVYSALTSSSGRSREACAGRRSRPGTRRASPGRRSARPRRPAR